VSRTACRLVCAVSVSATALAAASTLAQPPAISTPYAASGYVSSAHFTISRQGYAYGNFSGAGGFIDRLERTYAHVSALAARLELPTTQPADKLAVSVMNDAFAFGEYARGVGLTPSDRLLGFYDPRESRVVLLDYTVVGVIPQRRSELSRSVNPLRAALASAPADRDVLERRLREGEQAFALIDQFEEHLHRKVIQHEVAHSVWRAIGVLPKEGTRPAWLHEGLAAVFEVPLPAAPADWPAVNEHRLRDYRAAARGGSLLAWRELVSESSLFNPDAGSAETAYAQAWLLAWFGVREQPERLREYIRRVRMRSDPAHAPAQAELRDFEAVFGPIDGAFDARLRRFEQSLPATPLPPSGR